jgi:acetyl esterase/lipase
MSKKYNIHPDFEKFPVLNLKFSPLIIGLINLFMRIQRFFAKRSFNLIIDKHHISHADGHNVKVITMTPHGLEKPAPALIYYHGGGFAMTYASLHLESCERYANEAGCIVVFVEYRLAPKQPFPSGFDDCYSALDWAIRQADGLGIDTSRIAVGGDSAGGALAAGVAQKARDEKLIELCAQLLIYPVLDSRCSTPSATDFVDVPLWNAISNQRMWDMYLSHYPKGQLPDYAAPGQGQLQQSPPSYIETAEFDPLRDEGLELASALQQQGSEVVVNETKGTIHGYDGNANSDIAKQSLHSRIRFLQQAFSSNGK